MTRGQRRAHLMAWMVIGPLLLLALGWAWVGRSAPPAPASLEASP